METNKEKLREEFKTFKGLFKFLEPYKHRLILVTLTGSRSIGLGNDNSDIDIRAIITDSDAYKLGMSANKIIKDTESDTVIYPLSRFMPKAYDNAPDVLPIIFTNPDNILYTSPAGEELLNNRNMFLKRKSIENLISKALTMVKQLKKINEKGTNDIPEIRKLFVNALIDLDLAEDLFKYGEYITMFNNIEAYREIKNSKENMLLNHSIEYLEKEIDKINYALKNSPQDTPLPEEIDKQTIINLGKRILSKVERQENYK